MHKKAAYMVPQHTSRIDYVPHMLAVTLTLPDVELVWLYWWEEEEVNWRRLVVSMSLAYMKNWDPLELGPLLAMESRNGESCFSLKLSSRVGQDKLALP